MPEPDKTNQDEPGGESEVTPSAEELSSDFPTEEQLEGKDADKDAAVDDLDFDDPSGASDGDDASGGDDAGEADDAPKGDDSPKGEDAPKGGDAPKGDDKGFDDALLARAKDAGFDESEARAFGTADNLTRALTAQDRQLAKLGAGALAADDQGGDGDGGPQDRPKGDEPTPKDKSQAAAGDADDKPFAISDEVAAQMEPEVVQLFNDLHAHHDARVEALTSQVQGLVVESQAREDARTVETAEAFFAEQDESLFGKGQIEGLQENSTEFENRVKLCEAVGQLQRGIAASKGLDKVPPLRELLPRALRMEFPDHIEKKARRDVTRGLDKAKRRGTMRPTARRTAEGRTPTQDAEAAVKAKLAEIGED